MSFALTEAEFTFVQAFRAAVAQMLTAPDFISVTLCNTITKQFVTTHMPIPDSVLLTEAPQVPERHTNSTVGTEETVNLEPAEDEKNADNFTNYRVDELYEDLVNITIPGEINCMEVTAVTTGSEDSIPVTGTIEDVKSAAESMPERSEVFNSSAPVITSEPVEKHWIGIKRPRMMTQKTKKLRWTTRQTALASSLISEAGVISQLPFENPTNNLPAYGFKSGSCSEYTFTFINFTFTEREINEIAAIMTEFWGKTYDQINPDLKTVYARRAAFSAIRVPKVKELSKLFKYREDSIINRLKTARKRLEELQDQGFNDACIVKHTSLKFGDINRLSIMSL
jgi:hypothetical protein